MIASSIFLSGMLVLIIFNWLYVQTQSALFNTIILSSLIGFVAGIIALGVLTGITVLGTGLDTASIQILFGAGALLNILFQIPIGDFAIGLGLINNMVTAFSVEGSGFGIGIGVFISGSLSIMIFVSGIMLIQGSD